MRVPLSWLTEYVPLEVDPTDDNQVAELGRVFDSLGLVVEGVEKISLTLPGVVLARVLEIGAIEGADRIRRVLVDVGDQPQEIVCGAMNFVPGDVVPLATVGTVLPSGAEITARTIRGVTSNGMLCSSAELELSSDAAGLLIVSRTGSPSAPLPPGVVLGERADQLLGVVPDVVFDLAIEPNRPDALSIVGVARDVAARLSLPFSPPRPNVVETDPHANTLATVSIEAPERCHQLVARVFSDVKPFTSHPLVARRLGLCGMRSISAMVDASNYVMLELGQPTHPYDLLRLGGGGILVRLAHHGETLVTLDGVSHELFDEDLVICDRNDVPVGLAGVMGGASSEITDETTTVLLEVAEFEPLGIGQTAARHGARSEASARFWRGVDPEGLVRAADHVGELLIAGATSFGVPAPRIATGVIEDRPRPFVPTHITLSTEHLNARLGTLLSTTEMVSYLDPLGFSTTGDGAVLDVIVPSFRRDCEREVDLIEEVARHFGYEQIPHATLRSPYVGRLSAQQRARRSVRAFLVAYGADEAWTSSIIDPELERRAGGSGDGLELSNPIVAGESLLRTHLLPGLLGALRYNESHRNGSIRLFELGAVFSPPTSVSEPPGEQEHLGVLLGIDGDDATTAVELWRRLSLHFLVAPDATVLDQGPSTTPDEAHITLGLHPTRRGIIRARDGSVLGAVGEVDPALFPAFSLDASRIGWLVIDLGAFVGLPHRDRRAVPVTRFPTSDVDLSFVVRDDIPSSAVLEVLLSALGARCESCELTDVYRGPAVGDGVRSLTFHVRLSALDHTLSEEEIAAAHSRAINIVESTLGVRLRS